MSALKLFMSKMFGMEGSIPTRLPPSLRLGTSTEIYSYRPLKEGEIRLLELFPSKEFVDPILCHLHHIPIDDLPAYNALSYAWGTDSTSRLPIFIDGKSLPAMPNLEAFLRQHREDEAGSTNSMLWIDAICINQDDLAERRQQIGMMCRLYSWCSRLIVWLGVGDDDSKAAIDLLKVTAKAIKEGPEALCSWRNTLASRFFELGENHHEPLFKFFSRAWFSRAWIVQEYVFGCTNDMVFRCGGLDISQEEMEALHDIYASNWPATNAMGDPRTIPRFDLPASGGTMWYISVASLITSQMTFSVALRKDKPISLLFWLSGLRDTNATDPRDKVYGALGLTESFGQNECPRVYDVDAMIVDYTQPVQDIYASLVKSLVICTKRIDVLLACCDRSDHVQRSWIPDWSIRVRSPGFGSFDCGARDPLVGIKRFESSGTSDALVAFASDLSTMTVQGLVWDMVETFAPEFYKGSTGSISFFETNWHSLVNNPAFSSERDCLRRLWQTFLLSAVGRLAGLRAEDELIALGLNEISNSDTQSLLRQESDKEIILHTPRFLEELGNEIYGRDRLFLTSRNFIGKDFSGKLQYGDLICVLLGCPVPVALRRVGAHYEFIRSVYLDGIMLGEALEALERGEVELEDFELH
ncbi:heterokaryon incompatibility protein-domain-containing protein [Hyaloscypha finlandica]|nr:heterokaryon incompatibility protein-domain-containing protein [Hyaloscypha finlandica]